MKVGVLNQNAGRDSSRSFDIRQQLLISRCNKVRKMKNAIRYKITSISYLPFSIFYVGTRVGECVKKFRVTQKCYAVKIFFKKPPFLRALTLCIYTNNVPILRTTNLCSDAHLDILVKINR